MISAALGSLAAGLPLWVLPAPLLAAAGMAMFYDTRAFRDYLLFVLGALATGAWGSGSSSTGRCWNSAAQRPIERPPVHALGELRQEAAHVLTCTCMASPPPSPAVWFVWHHFWFLDMVFVDGAPLRALCALVLAALLPALLVPGLVHCAAPRAPSSVLLLAQAAALVALEEWLYAGDHEDLTLNIHPMYPAFLVVATSALGLAMARRLGRGGAVGEGTAYLLQCAYAAKLAMLVLPGVRRGCVVWPTRRSRGVWEACRCV